MTNQSLAIQELTDLVQQNMLKNMAEDEEFKWDVNVEILFLHSLFGLKPVGVNRFFIMQEIHRRFSNLIQREIHSKVLWEHLDSMYDMATLHESEGIPAPLNKQKPFELPSDLHDLVKEKYGVSLTPSTTENDADQNGSSSRESEKPKLKQDMPSSSSSKNTFATPGSVKSSKSTDSRPPSVESTSRVRSEAQAKSGKVKQAPSPVPSRSSKSEAVANVREETPEPKKKATESSSGKRMKSEPPVASSSKTRAKTEEVSTKKVNPEREVVKKGRASLSAESSNSKKGGKNDGKRTEADSSRKSADAPKTKPERNSTSSKSSRSDGLDSPVPTGSRKQSTGRTAAVVETSDKKGLRSKVAETGKKTPVPTKRRRI
ncbi:hypothetical protein JTE90_004767 [Oedothorax gibbosus]|uniref:MRG-binding protein n=1 Tax=Oedothorax gibbosus TaxID=931172 RepID=A0AAV6UWH6_9ARAC|nr:hypothetical protein JTE90_004767 [Oedothorax gibbosus]